MADSAIGSLPAVQIMQNADLFVLEQNGEAMKLSGELLASFIDRQIVSVTVVERAATDIYTASYNRNTGALTIGIPRGVGIASISDPSVSGLNKTYTITWDKPASASSATTKQFTVKDGDPIVSVTEVDVTHASGHLDVYQINFQERTAIQFSVRNGTDGNGAPGYDPPKMDSGTTGVIGTAVAYARQDHVHPSDTSRQKAKLSFTTNLTVGSWGNDPESLFADFPKRGEISCSGVTASMYPIVAFNAEDAMSGDFAPISKAGAGKVYVYASDTPDHTVTPLSVVVLP